MPPAISKGGQGDAEHAEDELAGHGEGGKHHAGRDAGFARHRPATMLVRTGSHCEKGGQGGEGIDQEEN